MSITLGVHIGHDRAVSVVQDGEIVFHVAVERIDRRKHSDSADLPVEAIKLVLAYLSTPMEAVDAVGISYLGIEASRVCATLEAEFRAEFPDFKGVFSAVEHHLAHALGALACSPFDEALVLVADGAGDVRPSGTQAESLFLASRTEVRLLDERVQDRPSCSYRPEFFDPNFFRPEDQGRQISLGLKYEQLTYLCGLGPWQASQTMALSAFGSQLFGIDRYIPADLNFSLRYVDLLDQIDAIARSRALTLRQFARLYPADIAATAQAFLQAALVGLVDYIMTVYNPQRVCFAGGVFLNCLANRDIVDRHPDKELFFLPPCNDEGQSIGAAAHACLRLTGSLPATGAAFPYLGFEYSAHRCESALRQAGLAHERLEDPLLAERLAELIAGGKICGVVRGRSEAGPRALGHRSILADPRFETTKLRLDRTIKRRAEFRPYAPMILLSRVNDYFHCNGSSPHMLLTARVRADRRSELPVVVNLDGTARLQTVGPADDAFVFALLTQFDRRTGVPVLLNTSFNDHSEPMVETPEDAIRTFLRTDLDVLVLGNAVHVRPTR